MISAVVLLFKPVTIGSVTFDVGTLLYSVAAIVVGVQAISSWLMTKVYAIEEGFMPPDPRMDRLFRWFKLETGLILAALLVVAGIGTAIASLVMWQSRDFGELDASTTVRVVVPAVTGLILGAQVFMTSFFLSILGLGRRNRPSVGGPQANRVIDTAPDTDDLTAQQVPATTGGTHV